MYMHRNINAREENQSLIIHFSSIFKLYQFLEIINKIKYQNIMNLLLFVRDIKNDQYLLDVLKKESVKEPAVKDKYNEDSEEEQKESDFLDFGI